MPELLPASPADRANATAFAGRVARWSAAGPIRLVADDGWVTMWAGTPFDVLVTRSVRGSLRPETVTVRATDLLAGLAVSTAQRVDPGRPVDGEWRARLPPPGDWVMVEEVPAARIDDLVRAGALAARRVTDEGHSPRHGAGGDAAVPPELLDSRVLQISGGGQEVTVPLRMLFALSGMGFVADTATDVVRVRVTRTWLRLDARFGAVVRRRIASLPLLV